MKSNNIYLIGFMASGKSSFGKKLARHLDRDFLDLDSFIEEEEELSINEIFALKGEPYFRYLETKVLKKLNLKNTIVLLGGGTPCSEKNIEFLTNNGLLIYLELPLKIIIGRLKQDKENRPLVKDLKAVELIETISHIFNSREVFYKKANLILNMQKPLKELKEEVVNYINS
tara:strand:+ start:392 stop:907 length:516 start_codon:yes stop_codon:yes gene_type:complete